MNRRQFSSLAALALGGTIHSHALASLMDSDTKHIFLRDAYTAANATTFSGEQRAMVTVVCEAIIPETDSPGATIAKVPRFIELIAGEWMTNQERNEFFAGLLEIDQLATNQYQQSFANCSDKQQITVLEQLEDASDHHPWYKLGAASGFETSAPFIAIIKELTIFGFFMSEVGSTQVLRMNHFPGRFEGDIALDKDASSWTSVPLM
jgi:gluconate 2-dehydrogenase gamma chain